MDIDSIIQSLGDVPSLHNRLGMKFHSTSEPDVCIATMPVNDHTRQPFGVLSGGASLALAETVAGVGSMAICPGKACVGVNVSGSHLKAAFTGDTITATARLLSRGGHLHVWRVDMTNKAGELVSTAQVTNYIMEARK